MKERAKLTGVEHDREITQKTDSQFLFKYQRAILLSLKGDGALDDTQYRCAEEKLKNQLRGHPAQDQTKERGGTP